jgi:DNA-directed RNA polymerase subunit RPC12/RpoP
MISGDEWCVGHSLLCHCARIPSYVWSTSQFVLFTLIVYFFGAAAAAVPFAATDRERTGGDSPPGQAPFTDTWYVQSDRRMLHANVVWRLSQKLRALDRDRAQTLIAIYEGYLCAVRQPLLDLAHVEFVPHLLGMKLWRERVCRVCGTEYVGPVTDVEIVCPACRIRRLFRMEQQGLRC